MSDAWLERCHGVSGPIVRSLLLLRINDGIQPPLDVLWTVIDAVVTRWSFVESVPGVVSMRSIGCHRPVIMRVTEPDRTFATKDGPSGCRVIFLSPFFTRQMLDGPPTRIRLYVKEVGCSTNCFFVVKRGVDAISAHVVLGEEKRSGEFVAVVSSSKLSVEGIKNPKETDIAFPWPVEEGDEVVLGVYLYSSGSGVSILE